jgi:hypothetical protein
VIIQHLGPVYRITLGEGPARENRMREETPADRVQRLAADLALIDRWFGGHRQPQPDPDQRHSM